ncbi:hypothetical protein [Paraburkholderia sediminicola]|uniref:hypothetical protein n=1 Tax=Paraburkholderia sediminicola TaxID=458836 RepID=UPI0038B922CE
MMPIVMTRASPRIRQADFREVVLSLSLLRRRSLSMDIDRPYIIEPVRSTARIRNQLAESAVSGRGVRRVTLHDQETELRQNSNTNLGRLTLLPDTNIIKLPSISASVH